MRYEDILKYIHDYKNHKKHPYNNYGLTKVIELGFCDGDTTRQIKKEFSQNGKVKIVALEPVINLYSQAVSDPYLSDVSLVCAAIGKENDVVPLYISNGISPVNGQNFYASSSIKKPKDVSNVFEGMSFSLAQTKVITLDYVHDYYFGRHEIIDFIHSDIQGAEEDMILGGGFALKKTRWMYTEVSEGGDYYEGEISAERILELLPDWELVLRHENNILIRNTRF